MPTSPPVKRDRRRRLHVHTDHNRHARNEQGVALLRRPFFRLFIGIFARGRFLFCSFCAGTELRTAPTRLFRAATWWPGSSGPPPLHASSVDTDRGPRPDVAGSGEQFRAQGGATTSGSEHGLAQGFRTGDNTAGYTLTSIELLLGVQTGASPFPTVTLHSGSPTGSAPEVADFTAPSSATGAAVYTFIPTTTVTLEMNTDYWVVATGGTIGWVWSVTGPGEDATSATGWSIANRGQYFDPDSGSWKDANGDWAFHITANGYEPSQSSPSSPPNCRLTSPRVRSPRSGTRDRTTAPRWW